MLTRNYRRRNGSSLRHRAVGITALAHFLLYAARLKTTTGAIARASCHHDATVDCIYGSADIVPPPTRRLRHSDDKHAGLYQLKFDIDTTILRHPSSFD